LVATSSQVLTQLDKNFPSTHVPQKLAPSAYRQETVSGADCSHTPN
jgi:hypothetical protein